jgi:hypothetical protein
LKDTNKGFYLQVIALFKEFYVLLDEMLHEWDTNIVEGLNKLFTKFLHKDRTYAMTIENKVRIYLAVAIDSNRSQKNRIYLLRSTKRTQSSVGSREFIQENIQKEGVNKSRRMQEFYQKLSDEKKL